MMKMFNIVIHEQVSPHFFIFYSSIVSFRFKATTYKQMHVQCKQSGLLQKYFKVI